MSPEWLAVVLLGAPLVALGGLCAWLGFSLLRFRAYYRHKGLEPPDLPLRGLLRYTFTEVGAMLTLAWWQLRAAHRDGLLLPDGPETGPPVLCIHGITQAGSNLWGLRRTLARHGRASLAVSYGRYGRTLEGHVPPVVRGLRQLLGTHHEVDVLAHSMGGVVLRLALKEHPELAAHVRRVVTLGSPHAGTAGGRGLPLGRVARALGRRSELLRTLPGLPNSTLLTTISARHDLVVYPQATCHLDGARTIDLLDVGHAGLLTRPAVHALVVDALCDDAPATASG